MTDNLTNEERLVALRDVAAWLIDQVFATTPTYADNVEDMLSGVYAPPVSWTNAELVAFVAKHKIPYKYHEGNYYERMGT